MAIVVVGGWEPGFEKVKFTRLLMDRLGMGLAGVKHATDALLAGESLFLEFETDLAAEHFATSARILGTLTSEE